MDTPPPPPPSTPPPVPPASASAPPPRRGWWARNWKWFVPLGCLTTIAAGAIFIFCIIAVVFSAMKSSDPYKVAVARAEADARVQDALGTPMTTGFFVSGSTNVNGGSGKADLSIPLKGPKGSGTLYVVAEKSGDKWEYSKLSVTTDGGSTIDLNSDSKTDKESEE